MMIWEFALVGLVAGLAAGYLGIGGGFVVVPALLWLFSRDPATAPAAAHLAVGTSLATMLATSLSSIVAHHRRAAVRWDIFLRLAGGLLGGALLGAWIADFVDSRTLMLVVALVAFLAGLQLLLFTAEERDLPAPGFGRGTLAGSTIGAVSSLVGIGGGSITAPWLMWHGIRAQQAVATAAAGGYPIALAGAAGFMLTGWGEDLGPGTLGYVHLGAAVGIAVFSVLAAPVGAWAVHKSPPQRVRRAFGVFLLLVAGRIAWQAF
ncbi:MAG: sulfite exporter TauE/SafE family protein [Pseudomonadota bacterium]